MKISDSEECPFCLNIPDTTLHALINAQYLLNCGDVLNYGCERMRTKASKYPIILGYIDNKRFIIDMSILNTIIIIDKMRLDCNQMNLIEVLRLLYKEMKADDYESEVNPKRNVYNEKLEECGELLCSIFEK